MYSTIHSKSFLLKFICFHKALGNDAEKNTSKSSLGIRNFLLIPPSDEIVCEEYSKFYQNFNLGKHTFTMKRELICNFFRFAATTYRIFIVNFSLNGAFSFEVKHMNEDLQSNLLARQI